MGRVAVDFGVGQGAKRSADIRSDLGQASNPERFRGQNQRNPGGREAEGQLAPKAFGAGCVFLSSLCRFAASAIRAKRNSLDSKTPGITPVRSGRAALNSAHEASQMSSECDQQHRGK